MTFVELPLTVFVVDDEAPARARLKELLFDCSSQLPLEVVGEAANGIEALELLAETRPDVILIDIRMPLMDGIELARHIRKLPDQPAIIFTTAYDSYALKAFELHAMDYLLKPIRLGRLYDALKHARNAVPPSIEVLQELLPEPRKNLSIHERGKVVLIPIEDVLYLRAELKYVTVRTAERDYLIEEALSMLEKEYANRFVRIHRNCLVSREAIEGFEKITDTENGEPHWAVKLKGLDEKLPISRRQQYIVKAFR
jgi:two-component system response regulator AlgR